MKILSKQINFELIVVIIICVLTLSCQTLVGRKYNEKWNERFSKVKSLNEYAIKKKGVIDIYDLKLEHYKLKGVRAKTFDIRNSALSDIIVTHSVIDTLIIQDSDIENVDFSRSSIGELVIRKSDLSKFICKGCSIKKIHILASDLVDSDLRIMKNLITLIDKCYINDSYLWDSEIKAMTILNTTFSGKSHEDRSHFDGNTIDSLLIKDSSLNVTFGGSEIKDVVLENVSGRYVDFAGIRGNTVLIRDSDVNGFMLSGTKQLNLFESVNSKIEEFDFSGMKVKKISIKNCFRKTGLAFMESKIEEVDIENCNLRKLVLSYAKIDKISLKNADIFSNSWVAGSWRNTRIEELILENVFIDGIFGMKNAYIGTLKTKNLKKGRNLDINYKGANFKL